VTVLVLTLVLTLVVAVVEEVDVLDGVVVVDVAVGSPVVVVVVVGSVVVAVVAVVVGVAVVAVVLRVIGVSVGWSPEGMPAVSSLTRPKTIRAIRTAPAAPNDTSATGLRYQVNGAAPDCPVRP
jgi:hypothetical protein